MRAGVAIILAGVALSPLMAKPEQIPSALATQPTIQNHWECVPIARALSGIQIFGNAHTWWGQAEGRYKRGSDPQRGAVLAFRSFGSMRLGHVAAVSRVIDDRTILLTHSNWSPINGRRGQIERNVKAIDVSPNNDWTHVKVWYTPTMDVGTTAWPTHGFIYPDGSPPMALPSNSRVAATMAGVIRYDGKPAKPVKLAERSDKASKKFRAVDEARTASAAHIKRDEEAEKAARKAEKAREKLAKKEDEKREKTIATTVRSAPTGRLDYLDKLLKRLR